MEQWRKNLIILWIGSFVTSASFSMVVPFLPLFLLHLGVKHHVEIWSGMLYSVPFICGAAIAPYWGSLADKYGRKPMILRSGFALFLIYVLTAFVRNPWEVLGLRALQGLLTGYIPSAIALVGTGTPEDQVGFALAMMATATSTGGIVGPLIGGVVSRWLSNRIAFASAGVLVLLATLLVMFWVRETAFQPAKTRSSVFGAVKQAFTNRPLCIALGLQILTAFSVMTIEPVLPLYIVSLGGSLENASLLAGIVFSLAGIASVLFAPSWGRWADHAGFRRVLLIGLVGGGLGTLLQIPFHSVWSFAVIRFCYGAFFCAVFPALNGLVVRATDASFRGRAFGLNQTANQLGNVFGPLIGGWIGERYTVHAVFWVTGILLLVTSAAAYLGRNGIASVGTKAEASHQSAT